MRYYLPSHQSCNWIYNISNTKNPHNLYQSPCIIKGVSSRMLKSKTHMYKRRYSFDTWMKMLAELWNIKYVYTWSLTRWVATFHNIVSAKDRHGDVCNSNTNRGNYCRPVLPKSLTRWRYFDILEHLSSVLLTRNTTSPKCTQWHTRKFLCSIHDIGVGFIVVFLTRRPSTRPNLINCLKWWLLETFPRGQ